MEQWQVHISEEAELDFDRLDISIRRRVLEKIGWFRDNFDNITPLPLGGKWRGFFKLRVGDWRIIYKMEAIKKLIIEIKFTRAGDEKTIVQIAHMKYEEGFDTLHCASTSKSAFRIQKERIW